MSKGRFVDVFVEPDSSEPSGYRFHMEEGGKRRSMLQFNKNNDKMKKSEHYRIEFMLHNTKGADLRFSKIKGKVMWATEVPEPIEQCPAEGDGVEGFYVDPTEYPNDRKLHVINTDMKVQFLSFALNFVPDGTQEGPDTQYICFDPIIANENGGYN